MSKRHSFNLCKRRCTLCISHAKKRQSRTTDLVPHCVSWCNFSFETVYISLVVHASTRETSLIKLQDLNVTLRSECSSFFMMLLVFRSFRTIHSTERTRQWHWHYSDTDIAIQTDNDISLRMKRIFSQKINDKKKREHPHTSSQGIFRPIFSLRHGKKNYYEKGQLLSLAVIFAVFFVAETSFL